jgi:hypothetical protein
VFFFNRIGHAKCLACVFVTDALAIRHKELFLPALDHEEVYHSSKIFNILVKIPCHVCLQVSQNPVKRNIKIMATSESMRIRFDPPMLDLDPVLPYVQVRIRARECFLSGRMCTYVRPLVYASCVAVCARMYSCLFKLGGPKYNIISYTHTYTYVHIFIYIHIYIHIFTGD